MSNIRLANPNDASAIIKILRDNFDIKIVEYTIYNTHGMNDFIRNQLTDHDLSATKYYVVEKNQEIIGFAEFKLFKNDIFLNNIHVTISARGLGLGNKLLKTGFNFAKRNLNKIELDVFSNNYKVIHWYKRLGFQIDREFSWLEIDIKSNNKNKDFKILNLPFANCVYNRFGFATLDIETISGNYSVGLLGKNFFRINTINFLKDQDALNCLKRYDPSRRIFCINAESNIKEIETDNYKKIADCFRMSKQLTSAK